MVKRTILGLLLGTAVAGFCLAGDGPIPENPTDRMSYSLGYQIGGDLAKQEVGLAPEDFLAGLRDGLSAAEPRVDREEMSAILSGIKRKVVAEERKDRAKRREESKRLSERYHGEEEAFLAANAAKDGVSVLPSGVQFKVIEEGAGRTPTIRDSVMINYRGTRIDGKEFGSSHHRGEPRRFRVDALIPGLAEALLLMKEGAKWEVFIPAEHAFRARGPLAERAVIYEVELVSVASGE